MNEAGQFLFVFLKKKKNSTRTIQKTENEGQNARGLGYLRHEIKAG